MCGHIIKFVHTVKGMNEGMSVGRHALEELSERIIIGGWKLLRMLRERLCVELQSATVTAALYSYVSLLHLHLGMRGG